MPLSELREKLVRASIRPKGLRFFSELSASAQEKAIAAERDDPYWFDSDDAEILTEGFKAELAERGFEEVRPFWSLNYCQGDGVAFYGRVYSESLCEKDPTAKKLVDALAASGKTVFIEITGADERYHHWNSMTVDIEFEAVRDEDELPARLKIALPALRQNLEEYLVEKVKEIAHELERFGYSEIEYRCSEIVIRENLTSVERLFEENGTPAMSEFEFEEWKKNSRYEHRNKLPDNSLTSKPSELIGRK